nr:hypothetical protein BaRGS_029979 [Batillaria attramentaria]
MGGPWIFMVFFLSVVSAVPTGSVPDLNQKLGCNPADVYFLLDCSSSVWIVDYDKQLEFVVSLINHLHISPDTTRMGLGVFSDTFYPVIKMGDYRNKDILVQKVRNTPYLSGNTYTGRGLHGMRTTGFVSDVPRANVTRVGVVVTDGKSRHRSNTVAEARAAREAGISLFAIGVGGDVDDEELAAMASEPSSEFSFHVASFDILATLAKTVALSTCNLDRPQADDATCGQKRKADIIFVYNAAGMGNGNVNLVRQFLQHIVGEFSMTSGNVRAGVISQSCHSGDIELDQVALLTLLLSLVGGALGLKFSRLNLDEVNEQDLANDTLLFDVIMAIS